MGFIPYSTKPFTNAALPFDVYWCPAKADLAPLRRWETANLTERIPHYGVNPAAAEEFPDVHSQARRGHHAEGVRRGMHLGQDGAAAEQLQRASWIRRMFEEGARLRAERDNELVERRLEALRQAAESDQNVIGPMLDCARAYCTLYEIRHVLEGVFGTYREPVFF